MLDSNKRTSNRQHSRTTFLASAAEILIFIQNVIDTPRRRSTLVAQNVLAHVRDNQHDVTFLLILRFPGKCHDIGHVFDVAPAVGRILGKFL